MSSVKLVDTQLIERHEIDHACELGLISQENVFVNGGPGTAKSLLADRFFEHFPSLNKFKAQLSKFSTEDVLFGPLDIPKLREGEYVHSYEGSILDAHLAFIDEIFDASDVLLRGLLSVLNEHEFTKGKFHVDCPLHMAIATANYTRHNEKTEAVMDRFVIQQHVTPLEDKTPLLSFSDDFTPKKVMSEVEILSSRSYAMKIPLPTKLHPGIVAVTKELGFTDRRIAKAVKIVKAEAYLNKHSEVTVDDLFAIKHMASVDPDASSETLNVLREVLEVSLAKAKQIEDIDAIRKEWENLPSSNGDDGLKNLAAHAAIIRKLLEISPVDSDVADYRDAKVANYREYYAEFKDRVMEENQID